MDFSRLYTVIAAIFVLLICGMFLRKKNVINDVSSKNLSKLVICIAQPALIINSLIAIDYSSDMMADVAFVFIFGIILHFILAIPAFFSVKFIKDIDERKITEFALLYTNCGFIGLPILDALFGPVGTFLGAFYMVTFHLTLWTWGISIFARKRTDIRLTVKKVFINYGTVPSFIGIVLFALKAAFADFFVIPEFVSTSLSYLASLCTPISLLIAGALIIKIGIKSLFLTPKLYFFSFLKLIAFPLFTALLTKLLGFEPTFIVFFTAITALPSASMVSMLAETYDINPEYSSLTVGISTLFSVVTIPVMVTAAQWISTL